MAVQPRSPDEADAYRQLFDRRQDYGELRRAGRARTAAWRRWLSRSWRGLQRRLQREFESGAGDRFFPGRGQRGGPGRVG